MIDANVTGLDELIAGLKRIVPESRSRITSGPMKEAAQAIAEEGNRRVHSPQGHARTFRVYTTRTSAIVSPGSRANFFSQRFKPVLEATVNATHSRVENVMRGAVESVVRLIFR